MAALCSAQASASSGGGHSRRGKAGCSLIASLGLVLVSGFILPARAFNFTTNITAVRACGDVQVTWQGGTPPYNLTVIAEADWPGTYNLSATNDDVFLQVQDGEWYGEWTYTAAYEPGSQLTMFMSDSTGIGTGGSSEMITVGDVERWSGDCWLSKPSPQGIDWMTDTSASVHDAQSCEPLTITWSDPSSQVQPNLIIGISPPQVLQFAIDAEKYNTTRQIIWDVDVPAGSRVILQGYDAMAGQGAIGRASLWTNITANAKGDDSCVDESSLPATGVDGGTEATETGSPVRTVTATLVVAPGAGMGAGRIAGLVIGVVAALLLAQVAFYFLCWKRRIKRAEGRGARGQRGEKDPRRLSRIRTTSDMDHLQYEPFPSTVHVDSSTGCIPSPDSSTLGPLTRDRGGPFDDGADAFADAELMSAMAEFDKASVRSMPMTDYSALDDDTAYTGTWRSGTGTRVHTPTMSTPHAITPIRSSPLHPFGDAMATTWTLADLESENGSATTKGLAARAGAAPARPLPARLAMGRSREARGPAAGNTNTASPIYIHEDAGRVQRAQDADAPVQEELPPRYDPDWRYEEER